MSFSFQTTVFQELYEINDDPKRIEFLDDYCAFLQRKGTPITRLPVMSKKTLDLYELYRLVCQKGGVLEVINNKLWQDVIKKLKLPSAISSAAFTLRTQYLKYLYPYECEKHNFSYPHEVKAIVESSKREREARPAEEPLKSHAPPQLSFFGSSPHMTTPLTSMNPLLESIAVNEENSLASLLNRRNLMLQYMQYIESQQTMEISTPGQTIPTEPETPVRIKREREDDDDHNGMDSKKSLLYNLLTPSNTESSYEEERSIPETPSERSEDLEKTEPKRDDLLMMGGMQFNIKKGSDGKLIVNLTLNGVTYEGDLYKTS